MSKERMKPSNNASFGEGLRRWRKEKGVTQKDLADRLDVSESYVACLEKGKRGGSIKRELADKIAEKLKLRPLEKMKFEIGSGFIPQEMTRILGHEPILELYSELADTKLSDEERAALEEDLKHSMALLLGLIKREKVKIES